MRQIRVRASLLALLLASPAAAQTHYPGWPNPVPIPPHDHSSSQDGGLLNPILDDYFFLPGRATGQVGHGSNQPSGSLTLASTRNATKGFIYFGNARPGMAFNEVSTLFGIGDATPDAVLKLSGGLTSQTSRPSSDGADGTYGEWSGGTECGSGSATGGTNLFAALDEVSPDDGDYIEGGGNPIINYAAGPSSMTSIVWKVRARRTGGTGTFCLNRRFRRGGTTVVSLAGGCAGSGISLTTCFVTYEYTFTPTDITNWLAASGSPSLSFDYSGGPGTDLADISWSEIVFSSGSTTEIFRAGDSNDTLLARIDASGTTRLGSFGANSGFEKLIIQNSTSQTVDPFDVRLSTGNKVFAIDSVGGIKLWDAAGTNRTRFNRTSSGTSHTLTWPNAQGGANTLLSNNGSGTMSWSTLGSLTGVSLVDEYFRVVDDGDTTKKTRFQNAAQGTGTTLTLSGINTASVIDTFPQWGAIIPAGGVASNRIWRGQNKFTTSALRVIDPADTTKTILWSASGASPNADLTLTWDGPADVTDYYPKWGSRMAVVGGPTYGTGDASNGYWGTGTNKFSGTHTFFASSADTTKQVYLNPGGSSTATLTELAFTSSVDRTITFPNFTTTLAGLSVAQTWTVSQSFWDNAFGVVDNADVSKALTFVNDNAGTGATIQVYWDGTGSANTFWPQWGGRMAVLADDHILGFSNGYWGPGVNKFTDDKTFMVDDTDTTKTISYDAGAASTGADLHLAWAGTGDRTSTFPDATTTLAGLSVTQTFTEAQSILPTSDVVPLTITQSAAGASADLFTVILDGNTDPSFSIDGSGNANMSAIFFYPSGVIGTGNAVVITADVPSAFREAKFPNISGRVPLVSLQAAPPPSAGYLGAVDTTGRTANIASTNLTNTATEGLYRVEAILITTTGAGAAGTLALNVAWTDNAGATNANIIAAHSLVTTGTRSTGSQLLRVAGGAEISYSVTVTGIYSTSVYAVYVRLTYLGGH